jgi:cyanate permease
MLAVLFSVIAMQYLVMGLVVPAFSALYSKVIPTRQRGVLFGLSTSLANVVTIGTGLLIPIVLTANAWWGGFPNGYALCFLVGFVILMAGYIPLAFTDEAPDEPTSDDRSAKGYTLAMWRILRHDRDFQCFSLYGWFSVFGLSATAFYVTYSIRELGSPAGESGWFTVLMSIGTLASLFWGVLADRTNNRVVLFLCSILTTIAPVWAVFAPTRLWFYPVILITAAATSGLVLAGYNLQLEFSPPARVPRYVALFGAVQFLPRLAAPMIGGVLADAFGFKSVFVVAALSSLVAVVAITRMRDPRGRSETVAPPASEALTRDPSTGYPMDVH